MRGLVAIAIAAAAAGCSCLPNAKSPRDYRTGYAAAWATAHEIGRRDALNDLRRTPAFRSQPLPACSDDISWLPRQPDIDQYTFLKAREADIRLLKRCRAIGRQNAAVARERYRAVQDAE